MTLALGSMITDVQTGESRFRLVELLVRGANYDVVLAEDTHLDDKRVCIKAIRYPDPADAADVAARRALLAHELAVLTLPSTLLPEPLDWLTIDNPGDFPNAPQLARSEQLLVYEHQPGRPLSAFIAGGGRLEVGRALRIAHELALFVGELHKAGFVFRRLCPEHVIIGVDDILHLVGCGNITALGAPPSPVQRTLEDAYVAPEVREADNPKLLVAAVDVYSLGGVLCLLLTGRAPLDVVESPFDEAAHAALTAHGPGVARLVARMLHVNPRKRFQTIDELLPLLAPHSVPDPHHPLLRGVELPAPWHDPRKPRHEGLTPGPLTLRPGANADAPPAKLEPSELATRRLLITAKVAVAAAVLSVIVVVLLALL